MKQMLTKIALALFLHVIFVAYAFAQEQQITGKVSDAKDGKAIMGATISASPSIQGKTDQEGRFKLSIPNSIHTLKITNLGYESRIISVSAKLDIALTIINNNLDEVVVVGYGTQKRKEVTSAVASVKAKDFNAGGVRSPLDLIQGKVAGLTITKTQGNNPNAGASIQLRGISSLSGDKSPLIVIDGIPGGNLDLVQQDDIASFDVLKDGSAAAIYGTRANAGVILITTKKGKSGEARFDYSTYFQRESIDKVPNMLSATQFRNLIKEGLVNKDQDLGHNVSLYNELLDKQNLSQYHNLAASGGTDKSNYRASVYINDAKGIAKQNDKNQFGSRININQKGLQDKLTMQLNLVANFSKANLLGGQTGDFEQAIQRNPTAPIFNEDGSLYQTQAYNNYNPLSRLAYRVNSRNQQTFSGDMKLNLEITKGLNASVFGAYMRDNYNDRLYRGVQDWDQRQTTDYQGMAYAEKSNYLNWNKTLEATVNYNKVIGDHSITALAGYSYQYFTSESFNVNNNGFTTDGFLDWNLGAGGAINNVKLPRPGMGSFKDDNTLIAFFTRVNYAFKGKYFLQAMVRHEGSSRFGVNHKWGTFPAISAGWTLTEENFMKEISFIDNLKLRVGFGVTGNQGIPNYQSMSTLETGGVYPIDNVFYQTYGAARNPNPNLKWEQKAEWNFGLDFSILKNKISGSLDVYNRLTTDLLYNYTAQQPSYVRDQIYTNVGALRNKGVELLLSAKVIQRSDFSWNVTFTASSQFNKLERLSSEAFKANWLEFGGLPSPGNLGNAIRLEQGGSVGNFYGKRFAGFNEEGKWLFYKANGSKALAADMNDADRSIIGNGVPKYLASLSNTFIYKNFDLTIFFRGKFAFDILNTKDLYFGNKKWLPNNILESAITSHKQLNDDPQYSNYYIEKGDFVKLDNITLGYNFNLKSKYIRNLRVYATGRNIITFTSYSGVDPELQDVGFEAGIDGRGFYPRTKSWTFGLNVGF